MDVRQKGIEFTKDELINKFRSMCQHKPFELLRNKKGKRAKISKKANISKKDKNKNMPPLHTFGEDLMGQVMTEIDLVFLMHLLEALDDLEADYQTSSVV